MQWCQVSLAILLEGTMIILIRQLSKASSRDYDHLNCFVLPKKLNVQAWPILEGNKRDYPRGASVNCVLISCICFVLGYLAFDFIYIQTLGLTMVYLESDKLREFKVYAIKNKYPGVGVQIFTNEDET